MPTRQPSQLTKEKLMNIIELIDIINESGNFDSDDYYELGTD